MPRTNTTRQRIDNYCRTEPSFTCAFAAWELGIHQTTVSKRVNELLGAGKLVQLEERSGPFAAVYRWRTRKEREEGMTLNVQTTTIPARELQDREVAYVTQEGVKTYPTPSPAVKTKR